MRLSNKDRLSLPMDFMLAECCHATKLCAGVLHVFCMLCPLSIYVPSACHATKLCAGVLHVFCMQCPLSRCVPSACHATKQCAGVLHVFSCSALSYTSCLRCVLFTIANVCTVQTYNKHTPEDRCGMPNISVVCCANISGRQTYQDEKHIRMICATICLD